MTLRKNGRTLYLDAPDTYNDMTTKLAKIDQVKLVAGAAAAATLTIYANVDDSDATKKLIVLKAPIDGTDEFGPEASPKFGPDSMNGLTAVLTGAGAEAFIVLG